MLWILGNSLVSHQELLLLIMIMKHASSKLPRTCGSWKSLARKSLSACCQENSDLIHPVQPWVNLPCISDMQNPGQELEEEDKVYDTLLQTQASLSWSVFFFHSSFTILQSGLAPIASLVMSSTSSSLHLVQDCIVWCLSLLLDHEPWDSRTYT